MNASRLPDYLHEGCPVCSGQMVSDGRHDWCLNDCCCYMRTSLTAPLDNWNDDPRLDEAREKLREARRKRRAR